MAVTDTLPLTFQPDTQSEVDAAWRAEFRRRIDDAESGRVQWLDADEMYAELRAELARERNR
jgi:putative addiction module component (TIGR02574 family)